MPDPLVPGGAIALAAAGALAYRPPRLYPERTMSNDSLLSPQRALIYIMVVTAAADREMTDRELKRIGDQVRNLPVFAGLAEGELVSSAEDCASQLGQEGGLDRFLDAIADSLPPDLVETGYALACEIAAADLYVPPEETRLLRILRDRLGIDRLVASAIERAVKARHTTL
ncbi:MAG: tellurite resistance TerB family protein [Thiotrichales bacterium]|nr:tellurite resistance TerB family protein [Thiotrichales bacterium]